ncbi:uncharacterized protein LOC114529598 [Dendronephthya gigantea]|uniref:uncharacterized protein LOC114529598 n=1 Tax=Dendronephthya gigantea TaxID=151771 RepID=UPI00106CD05B|nr:uncharacterized protein LOC114529598 [Dendronephthya gigantea]
MEKNGRVWLNVFFFLVIQRSNWRGQASITPNNNTSSIESTYSASSTTFLNPTTALQTSGVTSVTMTAISSQRMSSSMSSLSPTTILSRTPTPNAATSKMTSQYQAGSTSQISSSSIVPEKTSGVPGRLTTTELNTAVSPATTKVVPVSSSVKNDNDKKSDDEPKVELFVWEFVAIGCGVFIFLLLIVIVLLCCQNRSLKKKAKCNNYSLPIKENGQWIDNQDIPLWQKRASAFVSDNPVVDEAPAPTLTT